MILRLLALAALGCAGSNMPPLESTPVVIRSEPIAPPAPAGIEVLRLANSDARWRLRLTWHETTERDGNSIEEYGRLTGTLTVVETGEAGAPTRVQLIVEQALVDEGAGRGLVVAASGGAIIDIPLGPRYSIRDVVFHPVAAGSGPSANNARIRVAVEVLRKVEPLSVQSPFVSYAAQSGLRQLGEEWSLPRLEGPGRTIRFTLTASETEELTFSTFLAQQPDGGGAAMRASSAVYELASEGPPRLSRMTWLRTADGVYAAEPHPGTFASEFELVPE